ncbi:DUF2478 domain-containing protein [Rhodobacter lacus]|uniref:DUF2478 domain-containing protein n=1 Tax=Rhodobacter lacus TaxID=1641972 RepID=A0ABW5A9L2_9RHOB
MTLPLAAVLFDETPPDALLSAFARRLAAEGRQVRGLIQRREAGTGPCHCAEMDLLSLAGPEIFPVSQPLGPGAHGCRLDLGALAGAAQFLLSELARAPDLLILNRFGKAEGEGRGFRDVIAEAMAREVPVLTAVRGRHVADWATYTEGFGLCLAPDPAALARWFSELTEVSHAA